VIKLLANHGLEHFHSGWKCSSRAFHHCPIRGRRMSSMAHAPCARTSPLHQGRMRAYLHPSPQRLRRAIAWPALAGNRYHTCLAPLALWAVWDGKETSLKTRSRDKLKIRVSDYFGSLALAASTASTRAASCSNSSATSNRASRSARSSPSTASDRNFSAASRSSAAVRAAMHNYREHISVGSPHSDI
jgi:hypothetical protein